MTAQVRSAYSHTLNSCGWCSWWLSAKKPVGFYWTKLRSTTCSHARWSDLCMTIWLPWGKAFHYLQHLRFCLWCFWMVMVKIMRVCLAAFQHRPRLRSRGDKNVLPSRQDWEGSKFLQTLQSWSCRWIVFTLVFFCDFMRTFFDWFIVGSKSSSLLVWVLQEWLWCTKLFRKSLSSSMSWGQTSQKHQWSWFCHSFWWESKKKTIKIKIISCGTAGWHYCTMDMVLIVRCLFPPEVVVDDCCHLCPSNGRSRTISRVVDEFEDVCEQTGVTLSRPWNCGNACYGGEKVFGSCWSTGLICLMVWL